MTDEAEPLASCLYEGWVHHRRYEPEHAFGYRVFQLLLDLDELDEVFRDRWIWSTERPALAWFRRADHLGDPTRPLADCVRDLVEADTGARPTGPIRLLTHLRYAGFVMNPISLYYCWNDKAVRVETVVAQVHNTPWGERHCYVLPDPVRPPGAAPPECKKAFHVSPFLPMDHRYRWRISQPGESLHVRIENHAAEGRVFDATLALRRRPITSSNLLRSLVRFPAMTAQVYWAIRWQALRLWWKGATYHPHPRSLVNTDSSRIAPQSAPSEARVRIDEEQSILQ